jgi:CheY-like chemotaxis protein
MDKETFASLPQPIALVVDDEPLIRMDTADIIWDAGYHVIEASTADEAYEFLKKHTSLKLLFTDIQMPGDMDGLDLPSMSANGGPKSASSLPRVQSLRPQVPCQLLRSF